MGSGLCGIISLLNVSKSSRKRQAGEASDSALRDSLEAS
jgi:hypothetical protein